MQADMPHIRASPARWDGHVSLFGYRRILSVKKNNKKTAEWDRGKQSEISTMK